MKSNDVILFNCRLQTPLRHVTLGAQFTANATFDTSKRTIYLTFILTFQCNKFHEWQFVNIVDETRSQ